MHYPLPHKLEVPRTLFTKAWTLCTSLFDRATEEQCTESAFRVNEYPRSTLQKSASPASCEIHDTEPPEVLSSFPLPTVFCYSHLDWRKTFFFCIVLLSQELIYYFPFAWACNVVAEAVI